MHTSPLFLELLSRFQVVQNHKSHAEQNCSNKSAMFISNLSNPSLLSVTSHMAIFPDDRTRTYMFRLRLKLGRFGRIRNLHDLM